MHSAEEKETPNGDPHTPRQLSPSNARRHDRPRWTKRDGYPNEHLGDLDFLDSAGHLSVLRHGRGHPAIQQNNRTTEATIAAISKPSNALRIASTASIHEDGSLVSAVTGVTTPAEPMATKIMSQRLRSGLSISGRRGPR